MLDLCNRALATIGELDPIVSVDETTNKGRACKRFFDSAKNEVLRAYPWKFAVRFHELGGPLERTGFLPNNYLAYQLPPDNLRLIAIFGADGRRLTRPGAYELGAGGELWTNEAGPLAIQYISSAANIILADSLFNSALVARLASYLALALARSRTMASEMMSLYERELARARTVDSQERAAPVVEPGSWERAGWGE